MWPKQAVVHDGATYDFIIVGAGTAGSVIANRLTENRKISVLLIEAGGDPPLEAIEPGYTIFLKQSRYDWNYTSTSNKIFKKCHQKSFLEPTLGKMLGGSSSLSYMIYSRGHPKDYETWADITNDVTWKWENLLPYFIKSKKIIDPILAADKANYGSDGYMTLTKDEYDVDDILKSFRELNDVNDTGKDLGYNKALLYLNKAGNRQSSAAAFLTPVKNRINLHVLKDTLVTKINFDKDKNAVGVIAVTEYGIKITINARKEVIVSAGTFNSAKLLMLSGIGPKEQLASKKINVISDLPVGQNLQDHVFVAVPIAMEKSDAPQINPKKYITAPVVGLNALDKSQNCPDYQTVSNYAYITTMLYFCSFGYRFSDEICDSTHLQMYRKMGLFNQIVHLNPKSRGEVCLKSGNPMDPPVITTGYLTDENDLKDLIEYVKDFVPIVNTTYFRNIEAELLDPTSCTLEYGSDEYWEYYASCMFSGMENYVGTCAMGSVVDSKLKVYGVKRLRVADASVIPTITRGHTLGPVVMIGEKAADLIKQDLKCKTCS